MQNLTPWEICFVVVGGLLALAGAVNTVGAAVEKIAKVRAASKAQCVDHDERLDTVESDIVTVKRLLDNDKQRLDKLDDGNRVTQGALFALLSHAIDGNNVAEMKDAQAALHQYLIYGKSCTKPNENNL